MMSLDEIRAGLADRRVSSVAQATGLTRQAIYNVQKPDSNPLHQTMKALSDYLTSAGAA